MIANDSSTGAANRFVNSPAWIFAVGLGIRILTLAFTHDFSIGPDSPIWKTGPEMVNVASSIAAHHGFSSPFGGDTGPTAWLPPLYPYLLAGVFQIAGVRSNAAGLTILALQALFSALTCVIIYQIADRVFGVRIATIAAWVWALFPYAVLVPVLFIWETTLSAFLLTMGFQLSLDLPQRKSGTCVTAGLVWGIAALTNTALLSIMPFALLWSFRRSSVRAFVRSIGIVGGIAFLVVTPWLVRNWRTFHVLMPVRSNFAEQLWLGNHTGGFGRVGFGMNALENPQELQRYRTLGEVDYEQERKREALDFIRDHPTLYLRWTLYRVGYWWFAVGETAPVFSLYVVLGALTIVGATLTWRFAGTDARLVVVTILAFPIVYYLTDVYARYRHPVEPFMVMLATYGLVTGVDAVRARRIPPFTA